MQGVTAVVARISQDGAGLYCPTVATKEGRELPLPAESDLNVAKAQACKTVAAMLKEAGL
jgi:hypothetical protein